MPGRATSSNNRKARAFCARSKCGRGLFSYLFPSPIIYFLFLSLSLSGRLLDINRNTVSNSR